MRIHRFHLSIFLSDAFEGQLDVVSRSGGRDGIRNLESGFSVGKSILNATALVSQEFLLLCCVLPFCYGRMDLIKSSIFECICLRFVSHDVVLGIDLVVVLRAVSDGTCRGKNGSFSCVRLFVALIPLGGAIFDRLVLKRFRI